MINNPVYFRASIKSKQRQADKRSFQFTGEENKIPAIKTKLRHQSLYQFLRLRRVDDDVERKKNGNKFPS